MQIIGPITSRYWWKGNLESAQEWMCVIKTKAALYEQVEAAIRASHTYEVPEILATPVEHGYQAYTDWLKSELKNT
jgi:periplasmic divalent cation tolerance protein